MNFDVEVQQRFTELVRITEPPFTATSGDVIRRGRRLRRRRQVVAGMAGLASVAALGVLSLSLLDPSTPAGHLAQGLTPAHHGPSSARQARAMGVAETAALIESRVRADLPGGSSLVTTDVYGSDWNHDVALPPDQQQNATDWVAMFTVPDSGVRLTVDVGFRPVQDSAPSVDCKVLPDCFYETQPDGSVIVGDRYTLGDTPVRWVGRYDALSRVTAVNVPSTGGGVDSPQFPYTVEELKVLANDLQLVIPEPETWPPPPSQN